MRKAVSIILALALIASFTSMVYADDLSAGSGETEITAHIYSAYTITIPATINLDYGENGEVTISNANLENGYSVYVYLTNGNAEGYVPLTHTDGASTIYGRVVFGAGEFANSNTPFASFTSDEVAGQESVTKYFNFQVDNYDGAPGIYTGTMTYSFCCEPTT